MVAVENLRNGWKSADFKVEPIVNLLFSVKDK
jgi:hypothetical protein